MTDMNHMKNVNTLTVMLNNHQAMILQIKVIILKLRTQSYNLVKP